MVLPFMEPTHFLGSGSIGLLFASSIRMAFPSYPLTMLLRSHHERNLQSRSGSFNQQQQNHRLSSRNYIEVCLQSAASNKRPRMAHIPAEIIRPHDTHPRSNIRNLVLATKAPDTAIAVESIVNRLDTEAGCRIIILCNGALAVRDQIQTVLQQHSPHSEKMQLILASTTHGAYRDESNHSNDDVNDDHDHLYHVVHAGIGKTFVSEQPSLARLWDQSGLTAESLSAEEMKVLLWHKLAANCVINPLTALLGCENGQIPHHTLYQELAGPAIREISAVAKANVVGAATTQQLEFNVLESFVQQVIHDTTSNRSSMLQDVLRKRPTEIQYLNGYVVRKGQECGIETPANQELCNLVEERSTLSVS